MGKRNHPGQAGESRRHRSRSEREAALQRWVQRGVIAVSAILAIILLVALIITQFIAPNEVVAHVYDQEITAAQFQQRFLLERSLINSQLNNLVSYYQLLGLSNEEINQQLLSEPQVSAWQNELTIPDQLGIRVIQTLAEEALIQHVAQQMGLTVAEAEIEAERAAYFNYSDATATPIVTATASPLPSATATAIVSPTPSEIPTFTPIPASATPTASPPPDSTATSIPQPSNTPGPTNTPIPTLTTDERRENYETNVADFDDYLRGQGIRQRTIDAWYEARAWRTAFADAMREDVSETPYVALRHILVSAGDIERAEDILTALAAGESFSALAAEHSIDTGSAERGGFYDYAPVDPQVTTYVPDFAAAALAAEVGSFAGPVQSEFGYHIIQVVGRENRATTEQQAESIQEGRFADYLKNLVALEESSGNYDLSGKWVNHLPG